jgi:hypothetical protein
MTEILGKDSDAWHAAWRIEPENGGAGETEPTLERIQAANAACKTKMAAELIADGFSDEQVRRLLHLDGGNGPQDRILIALEV